MTWYRRQPDTQPNDPFEPGLYWNMWRTRQRPFRELQVGDTVFCVSGGTPQTAVVLGSTEVTHLVRAEYGSKVEAWDLIDSGIPKAVHEMTKDQFLGHHYTIETPDQGWLLAVQLRVLRKMGTARPADLRFQQNGWADFPEIA